jgi:hypothetical protein
MRLPIRISIAVAALLVPLSIIASGCGADKPTDVEEGEGLDLGGLVYNVAITRFLNPFNIEDKEYLVGQEPPPRGFDYLGVFLRITNNTDGDLPSAHTYQIYDTTHRVYRPLESKSPFALEIGATVPVDESLPIEDSTAATGPTESSMLLYLIPEDAPDSRPLNMEIQSVLGDGTVKLDL